MIIADYECISAIKIAVENMKGDLKVYKMAISMLTKLIEKESESMQVLNDDNSDEIDLMKIKMNYKENIFSRSDYVLYRGITYFYSKNYKEALKDFEESVFIKKETEIDLRLNSESETYNQNNSRHNSTCTDLSDVGLCSVNVNEINFNMILCLIMVNILSIFS